MVLTPQKLTGRVHWAPAEYENPKPFGNEGTYFSNTLNVPLPHEG